MADETGNETMLCWGNTAEGQLGLGGIEEQQILIPRELTALRRRRIRNMACGLSHTLFVMDDGTMYSCGNNDHGQLGHDKTRRKPEQIDALQTQIIVEVACGLHHSIALNDRGQVFTWGDNEFGQLGWTTAGASASTSPKLVKQLMSYVVIHVACGYRHTLVLTNESLVFSWGSNQDGQLGYPTKASHVDTPSCIIALIGLSVAQIAAGGQHSFCLSLSGALHGWGSNRHGQLGIGDVRQEAQPKPVVCKTIRSHKAMYIACGENHTSALTQDGGVFMWGAGMYGQLGHNATNSETNPRKVFELMGNEVTMIACGREHTIAYVKSRGKLFSFGLGGNGQLGTGSRSNALAPVVTKFDFNTYATSSGGHSVRYLCSGGDQCFVSIVSLQNRTPTSDFRSISLERQISRVTREHIEQLNSICDVEKPSQDLTREIEKLFTSPGSMNGSFLLPGDGHFDCGPKRHGVCLETARDVFSRIERIPNKYIREMIERSLTNLLTHLPSAPVDCEALRLYLSLACSFYFRLPSFYRSIICPFGRAVFLLDKNSSKLIDSWWNQLGPDYLLQHIEIFKRVIVLILEEGNSLDPKEGVYRRECIFVCMEMLRKLKAVIENGGHLISYESFYIQGLHEKVDFKLDYLIWNIQTGQAQTMIQLDTKSLPVNLKGLPRPYCFYPFLFDGMTKTLLLALDANLQMATAVGEVLFMPTIDPINPLLLLFISREEIVQDTLAQLSKYNEVDFKKPLKVIFRNEEALDAGGVKKEFFLLLLRELLDPKYGMFEYHDESRLIWFCDSSFETTEMYHLIGVVCGLAIYNGVIVDMNLPLALFKKLLKKPVTLEDLKQLMPSVGRSMQKLLDYEGNDVEEVFGIAFEVTRESYGMIKTLELEPGGSDRYVSQDNKRQYVDKYIDFVFTSSVEHQFDAFSTGFLKVCGSRVLELFQPPELQAMVVGNENYDWHQLELNTEYKEGYTKDDLTIRLFWKVFHEMPIEDKKKFLLFLTGCDRVPILGMKAIKLIIQPLNVAENWLPVAHTCFNVLDLPRYRDKETLRRKFLRAIENTQGFGLA